METYFGLKDREAQAEIDSLRKDMMRQEISIMKSREDIYKNHGFRVPTSVTSSDEVIGAVPKLEVGRNTVTNPYSLNFGAVVNPRNQDAESAEQRNGELGEFTQGVLNVVSDWNYNRKYQNVKQKFGAEKAMEVHKRFGATSLDFGEIVEDVTGQPRTTLKPAMPPRLTGSSLRW